MASRVRSGSRSRNIARTVDEIVEDLQRRRDRYGISYVIVPGEVAEAFAPVVGRLAGT